MAKKPSRKDMPKFVVERPPECESIAEWYEEQREVMKAKGIDVDAAIAEAEAEPPQPTPEELAAKINETRERLRKRFQRLAGELPLGEDPDYSVSLDFNLDEARELAFLAVDATIEPPIGVEDERKPFIPARLNRI